jgi:UDP-N-acetylmuramoyl-tripeptide--D-alanyl-D-alanine ligase
VTAVRNSMRIGRRLYYRIRYHALQVFTYVWRTLMIRTTVIAITGSVGKTTAKECLAAILPTRGRTVSTLHNRNDEFGVPATLRSIRPWHRFAVVEVGTGSRGLVERSARLVRPDIAIVLGVARTHANVFRTLEETAAEKVRLLAHVPSRGVAILNADDERVRGMASHCAARTVYFGERNVADVVASDVSSAWPERMRFRVRSGTDEAIVQTQLVGTHWTASVLAALTAAEACGIALSAAVEAVRRVAPFTARMQPVVLPQGATLIRDEQNGSEDTFAAMVKVLRESTARRRVLVVGDVSDSKRNPKKRQREIGKMAAELTDLAIFLSDHGHHAVHAARSAGMAPERCHTIADLQAAGKFLARELRSGDLVFLKSRGTDHVTRVLFAQYGTIGCWKLSCSIRSVCDLCARLQPNFPLDEALNGRWPRGAGE